jgi:hypothetical protein
VGRKRGFKVLEDIWMKKRRRRRGSQRRIKKKTIMKMISWALLAVYVTNLLK